MAIVVFEHSDFSGSGLLGEILRDHGHKLRVVELHNGDAVPVDLDDVDGVVACGGWHSPMDDTIPWLEREMAYLQSAFEADVPVVGLCFGSQILARALGGEVAELEGGIELGWHPVQLTRDGKHDVVHAGVAWSTMQLHWHRWHVSKLPDDAKVLANSERCPVQAWSLGLRTYAFQYHAEVDRDDIARWADHAAEDLEEAGVTRENLMVATESHFRAMRRIAERIFSAVALLVMPVDRRIAGLTKDLHH